MPLNISFRLWQMDLSAASAKQSESVSKTGRHRYSQDPKDLHFINVFITSDSLRISLSKGVLWDLVLDKGEK